jgi:hypothetical protein
MVGFPSHSSLNRTEGLNNLTFGNEIDAVQWFNATTKAWYDIGENEYFEPTMGYWVHATTDCEWEVPL